MPHVKAFLSLATMLMCAAVCQTAFADTNPDTNPDSRADATPSVPAGEQPQRPNISIYPEKVSLNHGLDFQSFVATLQRADGITEDVTTRINWSLRVGKDQPKNVARIHENVLHPVADGNAELVGSFDGHQFTVPIIVQNMASRPRPSFVKDVMPVLTRTGCNVGSCHGAARGKDGFNLSLFGFDPAGDYKRITREMGARRINLAIPSESLLLQKAVGSVPHTGGQLMGTDSVYYQTMLQWLQDGAPVDDPKNMPPAVTDLTIYPPQAVIEGTDSKQRFVAVATYADGTTRDVTQLAAFTSNNATSAAIDQQGIVTAGNRGEAFVMARFDTHTVGSQVLALPKELQYVAPKVEGNYIDQLVGKKLQQLRLLPSGQCTDEEFLRRVTIDIVGALPNEEEVAAFLNDSNTDKRARKIDELLERIEFSEIWAMKFANLLMIKSSNQVSYKSAYLYATWLTDKFARNEPIDQMVRELLTSSGGTFKNPPTNFYEIERDQLKTAENVAQVFMGIRTQCAQCHNHPFDRWTMNDYYGFAAFFSQIGRKTAEDYRERIVYNRFGGEITHPVTKQRMLPKYLGGESPATSGKDRRAVLADWLTASDNPYFATSIANRVWAHYMGVGLVSPVDDIRISNPPSNPELFDKLGEKLVEYKFDFRQLVRDICNSNAYQRSVQTNESNAGDQRNYAHGVVRRIPAETLSDCLSQLTGVPDKFRGLPRGARAVQIADGRTSTYFLNTFGRAPRNTVCDCEATTEPTLSQALHLLNGNTVSSKISQGKIVEKMLTEEKLTPEQVLDRLFVRAVGRSPTDEEVAGVLEVVNEDKNPTRALEDAYWALLNSREFLFNH